MSCRYTMLDWYFHLHQTLAHQSYIQDLHRMVIHKNTKKYDMQQEIDPTKIPAGVVGLGLMGCSITTCLLMARHSVTAVAPVPQIWNMLMNG